jgi:hypothetical protein
MNENSIITKRPRLTLRISQQGMSFSVADNQSENQIIYEPYTTKSGISQAANLREAFRNNDLLANEWQRAYVILDTPVLMVPLEEYAEETNDAFYHHAVTGHDNDIVLDMVLPQLSAVALFCINRDLKTVIDDHFSDVKYAPACASVWNHLHRRNFIGSRKKLFGYFHDKQLEIFAFQQNRFKFQNSYPVQRSLDAVYFLLYIWKLLGMDQRRDELHLSGVLPEKEQLQTELRKYLKNVFIINPAGEYNRAPITQLKGIPYDLITHYLK